MGFDGITSSKAPATGMPTHTSGRTAPQVFVFDVFFKFLVGDFDARHDRFFPDHFSLGVVVAFGSLLWSLFGFGFNFRF